METSALVSGGKQAAGPGDWFSADSVDTAVSICTYSFLLFLPVKVTSLLPATEAAIGIKKNKQPAIYFYPVSEESVMLGCFQLSVLRS